MRFRLLLDAMLVQLGEELFGMEHLHLAGARLGLDLLHLHDVLHELAESYVLTAQEVNHAVKKPDGLLVELVVVYSSSGTDILGVLEVTHSEGLERGLDVVVEN